MSRLDDDMIDPEFADLAVLVYAERPEPDPEFVRELDARVERRFETAAGERGAARRRPWLTWRLGGGALAAGLAAIVAVVVISSTGGTRGTPALLSEPTVTRAAPGTATSSGASRELRPAGAVASPAAGAPSRAPAPPSNGRKVVQSAQLALTAAPNRVEDVAQQVFDVIGRENGVVRRSSVTQTGGLDGAAEFALSVPSASLADTMTALSRLRGANVASRTDSTTDVNDRYVRLSRGLADARALRTGLLRQLARATTQTEIDSLHARIRDAETSIASLEAQLRSLDRAVNMSQITLTINAAATPAAPGWRLVLHARQGGARRRSRSHRRRWCGPHRPRRDRASGPLGAVIAWIAVSVRHRRRERALDLA